MTYAEALERLDSVAYQIRVYRRNLLTAPLDQEDDLLDVLWETYCAWEYGPDAPIPPKEA